MGHPSSTIRLATAADLDPLVDLGARFLRSSPYASHFAFSAARMRQTGEWLLEHGAILVADAEGEPVGMLGVAVMPHPIAGELFGSEVFWWVDPAARGRTGLRLLQAAEQWAADHGASFFQVAAPDPKVERIYAALGYRPLERAFQKRMDR